MPRNKEHLLRTSYIQSIFATEDEELLKIKNSVAKDKLKMQIGPDEGKLIYTLLKLKKAKTVIEIGTLVGYSTLWIAKALPEGGKVISIEKSAEHYNLAKANLEHSSQKHKISLVNADATEFLSTCSTTVDAIFIDADKTSYPKYLNYSNKLLNQDGLVIADNVFLWDSVFDKSIQIDQEMVKAMQEFNLSLTKDFESIIIPTAEGLAIGIKK